MKRLENLCAATAMALIACTSCTTTATTEGLVTLDLNEQNVVDDISQIVERMTDVEIVPLEMRDEALIKRCDKVRVTKDRIIILDTGNDKQEIKVFDRNGAWINTSQYGNGPAEINHCSDFFVRPSNNDIILCGNGKISVFDKNLRFSHCLADTFLIRWAEASETNYFIKTLDFSNPKAINTVLMVTDTALNVMQRIEGASQMPTLSFNTICVTPKGTLFFLSQNDTIYLYSNGICSPKYVFDYPEKQTVILEQPMEGAFCFRSKGYSPNSYFEADDVQSYKISGEGKTILGFRNIKSGNAINIKASYYSVIIPTATYGNRFVSKLAFDNIDDNIEILRKVLSPKDLKKVEAMNEDSNPLLLFFRIDI